MGFDDGTCEDQPTGHVRAAQGDAEEVCVDEQVEGHQWLDGARRTGSGQAHQIIDPATGENLARHRLAGRDDVDAAVT